MNISNKQLRKRLLDICNGAGYRWIEPDQYFESDGLEAVGRVIQGIESSFNLADPNNGNDNSRLRAPYNLYRLELLTRWLILCRTL